MGGEITEADVQRVNWVAITFAAMGGIGHGYAAHLIVENAVFTVLVAVAVGVGLYLFVPYALWMASLPDQAPAELVPQPGVLHRGATGLSLLVASIVVLSAGMVVESTAVPILFGVVFGAVLLFVLSYALDRPADVADAAT